MSKAAFRSRQAAFKVQDALFPYIGRRVVPFGLRPGMTVVVYGCGPGQYTQSLRSGDSLFRKTCSTPGCGWLFIGSTKSTSHPLVQAGLEAARLATGRKARSGVWRFSTNGVATAGRHGITTIGSTLADAIAGR